MAKAVKIELNEAGMDALLHSPELEKGLGELARKYAGDWQTDTKQMHGGRRSRVIASIYSGDKAAVEEELDTHKLVGRLR
ncbi:MAG: hypothetical protein IJR95_04550 [Lachnospiraceae bacterium]|nr:hypothetical protein [Lachnospiraceae bacterium]